MLIVAFIGACAWLTFAEASPIRVWEPTTPEQVRREAREQEGPAPTPAERRQAERDSFTEEDCAYPTDPRGGC